MEIQNIQEEAGQFAARWAQNVETDQPGFWEALRETNLPFLTIFFRDDPSKAHALCASVLRTIGRLSLGAAYALENHMYVLGGLEAYLTMYPNDGLRQVLDSVLANRQFVANTHAYVHGNSAFTEGMTAKLTNGHVEITGMTHFISLAKTADLVLLTLDGRDPLAVLFPVKRNQSITFGEPYFPNVLLESDTRPMRCERTLIPKDYILNVPRDHLLSGGPLAVSFLGWHLVLLTSAFLGGVSYLVDRTLQFAREFKSLDNRQLSRLDSIVAEMGQIRIRYGVVEYLVNEYTHWLSGIERARDNDSVLHQGLLKAQITNNFGTELIEEISRRCRRILGTRAFGPEYAKVEKIITEVLAAPLSPRSNAIVEKDVGYGLLAQKAFVGNQWPEQ